MKESDKIWDGIMIGGWDKKRFNKELNEYTNSYLNEWINVEDKLPETYEPVLVCLENNSIFQFMWMRDRWYNPYMQNGEPTQNKITHWMPLPNPPNF